MAERYLRQPVSMLRWIGLWPLDEDSPLWHRRLYALYGALQALNALWLCVSVTVPLLQAGSQGLNTMLLQVAFVATLSVLLSPLLALLGRRAELRSVIRGISDNLPWPEDDGQCISLVQLRKAISPMHKVLLANLCVMVVLFLIRRDYFCEVWFPLGLRENYNWSMLLLHVVASAYVMILAVASMYLYVTLILLLCGQLEYIYNHFSKLKAREIQLKKHDALSVEASLTRYYSRGVQHHQKVVRILWEARSALELMMLGSFLTVMISLCFTAFCTVQDAKYQHYMSKKPTRHSPGYPGHEYSPTDLTAIIYAVGFVLFELFLICWFGTRLTLQAEKVGNAVYNSCWYESRSKTVWQCVLSLITISNKTFALTAGGFVPVSITTMVHILQETVSYIMVMSTLTSTAKDPRHHAVTREIEFGANSTAFYK